MHYDNFYKDVPQLIMTITMSPSQKHDSAWWPSGSLGSTKVRAVIQVEAEVAGVERKWALSAGDDVW